jgi:SAM-dependent methyltransferase
MHNEVKNYYGKVLQESDDLQTDACATDEVIPEYVKQALSRIHDEVLTRYYGCGLVLPQSLKGKRILDLGCGAGRDCYALAQMVGEEGEVIGVDMTDEQLAVANQHIEYHRQEFGYQKANTVFKKGYIERLDELDLADNSIDIIVSNCVINLCPDKENVLKEAYRVLKPGGELYFSDVYADRRVPQHLVDDPVLYGECLGGALYWNDFINLSKQVGFLDPRLVKDRRLGINNEQVAQKVGHIEFYSATYRLFKTAQLESHRENYGQKVTYRGGIDHHLDLLVLDKDYTFEKGVEQAVCGNTWRILQSSRFASYFDFVGDFDEHRGIAQHNATTLPFDRNTKPVSGGCC